MGDRATIQLVSDTNVSPLIYLPWDGYRVIELLQDAAPNIRRGDLDYATARLIGILHNKTGGDGNKTSLGVSNCAEALREDTVGDAGHFQRHISTGEVKRWSQFDLKQGEIAVADIFEVDAPDEGPLPPPEAISA